MVLPELVVGVVGGLGVSIFKDDISYKYKKDWKYKKLFDLKMNDKMKFLDEWEKMSEEDLSAKIPPHVLEQIKLIESQMDFGTVKNTAVEDFENQANGFLDKSDLAILLEAFNNDLHRQVVNLISGEEVILDGLKDNKKMLSNSLDKTIDEFAKFFIEKSRINMENIYSSIEDESMKNIVLAKLDEEMKKALLLLEEFKPLIQDIFIFLMDGLIETLLIVDEKKK